RLQLGAGQVVTAIDEALHELAILPHYPVALRFRNLFPLLLVEAAHQHVLHGALSLPTLRGDQFDALSSRVTQRSRGRARSRVTWRIVAESLYLSRTASASARLCHLARAMMCPGASSSMKI